LTILFSLWQLILELSLQDSDDEGRFLRYKQLNTDKKVYCGDIRITFEKDFGSQNMQ